MIAALIYETMKAKRKALAQHGAPNKKKKTVIEEKSIKKSEDSESVHNFLQVEMRQKFEEELKCNICTEIYIKPTVLNCSHTFCEYCITKWKKQQERCPICRERIEKQIRILSLEVFIEKVLKVLTPEESKARSALIVQRERKNDSEESTDSDSSEEDEVDVSNFMEDSSEEDLFSSDENPEDFLVSDSYSDGSSDYMVSDESSDRSTWSEEESSFNLDSDLNSNNESDSDVG